MHLPEYGLGGQGEFGTCHPLVNAGFFFAAAGITMFSMSPVFLGLSLAASASYTTVLQGWRSLGKTLGLTASIVVLMSLINGFFTHDGDTVLFYINSNRITAEGFFYGGWAGVMLAAVMLWFSCFGILMTSDRLIYLFGRAAPVCGLVVAMIFRYISLLRRRFAVIHAGQRCMGKTASGALGRARQRVKEGSILVAWSLESSIDTADSMAARGCGLHGRTSFHLFRLEKRDILLLCTMGVLTLVLCVGVACGDTSMYYYPRPVWPAWQSQILYLLCFAALLAVPFCVDLQGELRWKQYDLKV